MFSLVHSKSGNVLAKHLAGFLTFRTDQALAPGFEGNGATWSTNLYYCNLLVAAAVPSEFEGLDLPPSCNKGPFTAGTQPSPQAT